MSFWIILFSILTIAASLGVVLCRTPINSALCLVLTLFFIAAHFALLGAHFLAAVQVMVYAGAIVVLLIFVIMLLGVDAHVVEKRKPLVILFSLLGAGGFFMIIVSAFCAKNLPTFKETALEGSTSEIGLFLFNQYLYPFEIASVLILVAVIGAVVLGYDPKRPLPAGRGLSAKRSDG